MYTLAPASSIPPLVQSPEGPRVRENPLLFNFCYYSIVGEFSCRFQTNENISTTSFITVILMLQLLVYLIAGCGLLFFRLTNELWNYYDLTVQTIKTSLLVSSVHAESNERL